MGLFGTPQEPSPQDKIDLEDLRSRVRELEASVAQLQAQVAMIGFPFGGDPASAASTAPSGEPDWLAQVRALRAQGNLISAIKLYRDRTGVGLKEAKDAVEVM